MAINKMMQECPPLEDFLATLPTSGIRRLIGIFPCGPDEYLSTVKVLESHGYHNYETVQCEIQGERDSGGDGKWRAWTSAVKKQGQNAEHFVIFIGFVRALPGGGAASDFADRWVQLVCAVHELGHADDMDKGVTFRLGQAFNIEEAEYYAHNYTCKLLRERRMVMGLITYLSTAISSMAGNKSGSAAKAATRFTYSEEYDLCLNTIPKHLRRHFGLSPRRFSGK